MTGERTLHEQFIAWLKKHGFVWFHSRMDKPTSQACGDPDFIVVKGRTCAFVEFKMPKGKLSEAQERRFSGLGQAGACVCVAKDLGAAIAHVEAEFSQGGDAKCGSMIQVHQCQSKTGTTLERSSSNGADQSNPASAPSRLYIAHSKNLGDVVVARNLEGHLGAIRLASGADLENLPRLTGAVVI